MFDEATGDPRFFERPINQKVLRRMFAGDVEPAKKRDPKGKPVLTAQQERIWKAVVETVQSM